MSWRIPVTTTSSSKSDLAGRGVLVNSVNSITSLCSPSWCSAVQWQLGWYYLCQTSRKQQFPIWKHPLLPWTLRLNFLSFGCCPTLLFFPNKSWANIWLWIIYLTIAAYSPPLCSPPLLSLLFPKWVLSWLVTYPRKNLVSHGGRHRNN